MLIASVRGVGSSRLVFSERCAAALLLDEGVGDEVVDDGRVDGGIGAGPQNNTRGGDHLECIEHVDREEHRTNEAAAGSENRTEDCAMRTDDLQEAGDY